MQILEILFLLVLALGIARLLFQPVRRRISYAAIGIVGLCVTLLGAVIEGLRWQMLPAYFAFGLLMLALLKKAEVRALWRRIAAVPLVLLMGMSAFLIHEMPVVTLPAPSGPYGVGTFGLSLTDAARKERYAPGRNREIYVEVWYPAEPGKLGATRVRTLFQELYEGDYTRHSFLFGYLKAVPTHSHVAAAMAAHDGRGFPVLLFNHALAPGFTSQNQLLMEHLASHGYVVFSIAHPYQTAKANLGEAGTVSAADGYPADLNLPARTLREGLVGRIFRLTGDVRNVSAAKQILTPLAEQYLALDVAGRKAFVKQAVERADLKTFRPFISEALLRDYFLYEYMAQNSMIAYWAEDIAFVADRLGAPKAPVAGFSDALDTRRLGVFGMSMGGAAATEFCKIDLRCKAGANLDGTVWGRHWDRPVPAPFLMLYNEEHQGGNDFAYLPPIREFREYTIDGASHFDFTDFTYALPVFKTLGLSGTIDGMRMIGITNRLVLNFFDHALMGKPVAGELIADQPGIRVRHHEAEPLSATRWAQLSKKSED